ncbi:methylated-DNA--[protein]-cysteine S-methyltransferase [Rhizosphaericola mali]|uniref:Methylated-DNA--protein-cysteine methyltransferase n=1 Tax=Rhizosphaericola mali TaxID=2545455 RepID=A0A5P2G4D8_9BACT|nr:methylated-DNA--[protein]-cysteine S-methyltransferase [Rhizosphaericola mali]QES90696.1 methylated-DNA--[protein]-cysteine S-methyltransferase [Rhizosphaericola mali]
MRQLFFKDMDTPVGKIRLVSSNKGLAAILWEDENYKRSKLDEPILDNSHPILLQVEQQLAEYFTKKRTVFKVPLDFIGTDFQVKVWNALLTIQYGKTKTYGALAQILGDIKAVRAVGGALNKNPIAIIVPCHRVVGADGKMIGFAGGVQNKKILLELESDVKVQTLF